VGRTALFAVLACLCRAQSPQELAAVRQRQSILVQQEAAARAFSQPANPALSRQEISRSSPGADFQLPAIASLRLQAASIGKQTASLARQREAWKPLSSRSDPAVLPAGAEGPAGPSNASTAPPDGEAAARASPFWQQEMAMAQQPRPVWPEPPPAAAGPRCEPLPAPVLLPVFQQAAAAYGLAPSLLRAVAEKESSLRPCAVSPAGALGLMQLMPETASWLGITDPFDVEQNVHGAARFLRFLLDRFDNDLGLALGAYNAGPGRVESFGGIPPIPETQDYVAAILRRLRASAPGQVR
jgi:soluble lytic murein transglycosylase-like protein